MRVYKKESVVVRLERHIERIPFAGCWMWNGAVDRFGYGRINVDGKAELSHRVSYRVLVGEIPAGLELDHLCRNPSCVNPLHLEPVTRKQNTDRGLAGQVNRIRHLSKTHCKHGHEYSISNTYIDTRGNRNCRKCRKTQNFNYLRRKK
jgi:hypothetical protein